MREVRGQFEGSYRRIEDGEHLEGSHDFFTPPYFLFSTLPIALWPGKGYPCAQNHGGTPKRPGGLCYTTSKDQNPDTSTSSAAIGSVHLTRWTAEECRKYRKRSGPAFWERRLTM